MGSVIRHERLSHDIDRSHRLPVEESAELAAYREQNLKPPPNARGQPQPGPPNPPNDNNTSRKRKAPKNPPSKGETTAEKSRFFIKPKPEVTASQLMKNGIFSPLTRTTTIIEIESDDEMKRISAASTRAKAANDSLTRTETEYSFGAEDFMDNPDFFRELEKVESVVMSQQFPPSISVGPSQTRPTQNANFQNQAPHPDAIEVDTDKENDPTSERRVRRKVATKKVPAAPNQSVISIEDSD